MTFILARILPLLSGVGIRAIAMGVAATMLFAALGYGVWAIRNDARMDERREWQDRMAAAEAADRATAAKRAAEATALAAAERAALESELALAHEAVERIGKQLASRPRVVAYPKGIIAELNR
jgi:hypothetical protein